MNGGSKENDKAEWDAECHTQGTYDDKRREKAT